MRFSGLLLVGGGLYLIGEFGFRIFDVMLNVGGQPATWDIVWTSTGAALIFVAVLLNGWSPWATLVPGLALTAAGVWSIAWYDGADRVASPIDRLFARPEMVVWGITGWLLVLGLMLLGASGAADHRPGRRARRRRPESDRQSLAERAGAVAEQARHPPFRVSGRPALRSVPAASWPAPGPGATARPSPPGASSAEVRPSPAASLSAGTNTGS